MMAEHDARAWFGAERKCLGSHWDPALRADAYGSADAPDVWPPRAIGGSAQYGALLLEGQVPGLAGRHVDFAMPFLGVVVFT